MKEVILYIKSQYLYAAFPILMCTQTHTHINGYVNKCKHTYMYTHICMCREGCMSYFQNIF